MEIIHHIPALRAQVAKWRAAGARVGFVPTMGYLHTGHGSLIEQAKKENDHVVVSIFVNPTQFGVNEDLATYPRDLEGDTALCEQLGVSVIFYPTETEMYPQGREVAVSIGLPSLSQYLCGKSRPTHFNGVCLVVLKLFNMVQPHRAYFGKKDYQQYKIIQTMVQALNLDLEIIGCDIIREASGLALSSRNSYLSEAEKTQALVLWESLNLAQQCLNEGEREVANILKAITALIETKPLARIDYVSFVDEETLTPVTTLEKPVLLALAVFIGKTRLIDNRVFGGNK